MWKNCHPSVITTLLLSFSILSYVDADMTNEEKTIFYKQLEKSLTTDANLYALQNLFYPYGNVQENSVLIYLCNEDFIVKNINYSKTSYPAFRNRSDKYYEFDYECYYDEGMSLSCGEYEYIYFTISVTHSSSTPAIYLSHYLDQLLDTMMLLDPTWCQFLSTIARQLQFFNNKIPSRGRINLSVSDIPTMPNVTEAFEVLSSLFSWVKYYARTGFTTSGYLRLESDWSIISSCYDGYQVTQHSIFTIENHKSFLLGIAICLNLVIMVAAFYIALEIPTVSDYLTKIGSVKMMTVLFWSAVILFNIINFILFISNNGIFGIYILRLKSFFILTIILVILELIVVHLLTQKVTITSRICCIRKPMVVRAFQTYAFCSIIWFAHRIGTWFIISIYYFVVSPSQTSAFVALFSSVVLSCIIITAFGVRYCCSSSEKKVTIVFKVIMLIIFLISMILVFIFFTFIFVDLTQHGLSASGIGSIILSLVLPFVTVMITVGVKRYLKKDGLDKVPARKDGYSQIQDSDTN